MAALNKVTTDTYTVGGLAANQILELYRISEEDLSLVFIRNIEAVDLGGDFNNDFNVDFNGGAPTVIVLEGEGIYVLKIPSFEEEYLLYNYTSLEVCIRDLLNDIVCNKCSVDDLEANMILLTGHYLFNGLPKEELWGLTGFYNYDLHVYNAGITIDEQLEFYFKLASRLYLYCQGCDPNSTSQCNCP